MRKKHNLKQRMLKREKKLKFIRKVKKFTCLSTVALMVISILNSQMLTYATSIKNNNQVLKIQVEYNEDYSKANIKFDVNSVDKEKYEITTITSDKDGKAIYDKNKVTEENKNNEVTYETIENGSYSFTVKYVEKQEKEVQAINENVKESEPEMEGNTAIEGTVENNKDSEKQQVEKQEEKVSENTIVEEKKEEKIVVDVSKIKTVENEVNTKDEEIKEEVNDAVDTNKSDIANSISEYENIVSDNSVEEIANKNITNEINSEFGLANESVNLEGEFYLTGSKQFGKGGIIEPVDTKCYSVNENIVNLGNEAYDGWTRQTIVLTSKYSVDFKRNFTINGKANLSSIPEGFAIGFHNDKDYISQNTGGSMGIYHSVEDGDTSLNDGLNEALVVEVDSFHNPTFGDNDVNWTTGHYLSVNTTYSKGNVITTTNKEIGNDFFNKFVDFEIEWFESDNKIKFNFGGNIIETKIDNDIANKLKSSPGYYSIATGINYEFGLGTNTIIMDSFKYTDMEPIGNLGYARIYANGLNPEGYFEAASEYSTANLQDRDLNKYLGTGQTLDIKLAFSNAKQSAVELPDYLNIEKLQIGSRNLDIVPGSIAFQENDGKVIPQPDLVFDRNTPLQIKYPANKGVFNVYMKVKLPDDLRLNINYYDPKVLPYLQAEFLLGKKGMTQKLISRNVAVATAPITEGYIWAFGVGTSPAQSSVAGTDFDKEKLARVQLYDEIVPEDQEKRSLNTALQEGTVKLKQSQHYYFDDNKNMFVPITPEEFAYSSKTIKGETGVYAYEFDVSDNRRSKVVAPELISNKSVGKYTLNAKGKGSGKNSFILTSANEITLSETEISNIVNTEDFKNYLIQKLSIKGYEDNGDLNVKKANIEIDLKNLDINDPKPGDYTVTIKASNADGSAYSNKNITVKVTENTWSYDTPDRTEENGASGYIVIPKYVNMKGGSGVDKDKLVAESEIFFANYPSATNVSYGVSVEKQFNLIKTDDPSSKVLVTSSSDNGQDEANNKWYIGKIGNQNTKGKGLNVKFTASRDVVDRSKGKWRGDVTFYFSRVS